MGWLGFKPASSSLLLQPGCCKSAAAQPQALARRACWPLLALLARLVPLLLPLPLLPFWMLSWLLLPLLKLAPADLRVDCFAARTSCLSSSSHRTSGLRGSRQGRVSIPAPSITTWQQQAWQRQQQAWQQACY
jgi:hypothetical protein